jgi:hypothetical protein
MSLKRNTISIIERVMTIVPLGLQVSGAIGRSFTINQVKPIRIPILRASIMLLKKSTHIEQN